MRDSVRSPSLASLSRAPTFFEPHYSRPRKHALARCRGQPCHPCTVAVPAASPQPQPTTSSAFCTSVRQDSFFPRSSSPMAHQPTPDTADSRHSALGSFTSLPPQQILLLAAFVALSKQRARCGSSDILKTSGTDSCELATWFFTTQPISHHPPPSTSHVGSRHHESISRSQPDWHRSYLPPTAVPAPNQAPTLDTIPGVPSVAHPRNNVLILVSINVEE